MLDEQPTQAAVNRQTPITAPLPDVPLCSGFGGYHSDNPASPFPKPYNSISLPDIVRMVTRPSRVAKEKAQWFIPSELHTRSAELQRKNGAYFAVWGDIDNHTELSAIIGVLAMLGCFYIVYSSRSSTVDKQKWRAIIPLATPATAHEFEQITAILNDKYEQAGIVPDRASERVNQICYLPNKGEFYQYHIENGHGPLAWQTALADELNEKQHQAEQLQADRNAQRERSRQKGIERMQAGGCSPVDTYNMSFPLEQCLETYGYRGISRKWLSPNSESGKPGVTIKNNKWFSSHNSDADIGKPGKNGGRFGDAFDLFVYYEYGGDLNAAIKAAGDMFMINGQSITKNNQQNYAKQNGAAINPSSSFFPSKLLIFSCRRFFYEKNPLKSIAFFTISQ